VKTSKSDFKSNYEDIEYDKIVLMIN